MAIVRSGSRFRGLALLAIAAAGWAAPTLAGVKAGVDAWSTGDFARAVAEWREPAAAGDPDALFNLAQAYRLGNGVPQDARQAEALYAQAAAKGHLKAADNYGLLLFQNGRHAEAMPYLKAAAERGDPRAQYLVGLAHFNGDLLPRDWVRAYALLTLAGGADLPQAASAISQMDEYIPLAQRQQAQSLAAELRAAADAARSSQMAAADLAADRPTVAAPKAPVVAVRNASTAEAGADHARSPVTPPLRKAEVRVAGPWKVQLGAFSLAGGADRLWAQLAGKPVLAGKGKQTVAAGKLTKLFATGWATQASAQAACDALKASGQGCIVTR